MLLGSNGAGMGQKSMAEQTKDQHPLDSLIQYSQSHCLIFINLFDPTQVDLKKDPSFFIDIKE
jgi:hypothetical protein